MSNGPEPGSAEEMMYDALEDEFGGKDSSEIKEDKKKQPCFHCKKSRPCKCDEKDWEDQEASDPTSPKFDWKRFGGHERPRADYKENIN
jgi:hypothetical protein